MPELDPMKRRLTWTVYATPLMDPYYRLGPVHTCLYVRACRLVTGTSSYVPWNGRGRRLVELTDGCYSGGDSQGLPGFIHPRVRVLGIPTSVFNKNSTLNVLYIIRVLFKNRSIIIDNVHQLQKILDFSRGVTPFCKNKGS